MAAANRSSTARRSGSAGSASSSSAGSACASWARARRRPLFTAVVVVPSRSATCAAGHSSTSRKISTARCRADRYCSAATKASRIPARDTAAAAGSSPFPSQQRAGKRLQPRHLRPRHHRRLRVLRRPAQPRRQRSAAPPVDRGQAYVGRDPVQPGPHRRTALKPVIGPPRPQVRLLHQVLGLLSRAQHPVAVSQQLTPEPAGKTREILADRHRLPPTRPRERQRRTGPYIQTQHPPQNRRPPARPPAPSAPTADTTGAPDGRP